MNKFNNKQFGDMLTTRDGRKAVYLGMWEYRKFGETDIIYKCWMEDEDEPLDYGEDGKHFH